MKDRDCGFEVCDFMHLHEDVLKRVCAEMPGEEVLSDLAELFRLFSDSTRVTHTVRAVRVGDVRLRHRAVSFDDAVGDLAPAPGAQAG